ncbi:MAG: hypothetical protein V1776_05715 [Candidatus Diapherotrites archaeon]
MFFAKGQLWSLDVVLAGVVFTLALGLILSQTELNIFASQQERNMRELQLIAYTASNALVSKVDIAPSSTENIRCGPNFSSSGTNGWSDEGDLSWLENCLIQGGNIPSSELGIPAGYSFNLTADVGSTPTKLGGDAIPPNVSFASVQRTLLLFASQVGPDDFRECLDAASCSGTLTTFTLSVWRSS